MSSGISGANFWIPLYLLGLQLDPRTAFWVGLLTTLFGFGSGVVRNLQAGTVDKGTVGRVFLFAGPSVAFGSLVSARLPLEGLLWGFASFAALYGGWILLSISGSTAEGRRGEAGHSKAAERGLAAVAGFLHGLIATGAGTLLTPFLMKERKVSGETRLANPATAVGSTVVLLFGCSLVAAIFRLDSALLDTLRSDGSEIFAMVAFAGPGAAVGGQLGPRLAQRLPRRTLRLYVGVLLILVGAMVALRTVA